jgi:hypothetical protein
MKTVNKKEYPLVDELINSLLEKFKKQGWQFPENLPEIYLDDVTVIVLPTDEKNGLRGFNPDYNNANHDNSNYALLSDYKNDDESPKIIIYKKVLELTAKMLEEYDRYLFVPIPRGGYDKVDKRNLLHFKQEGIENDYGISLEDAKINLFYCAVLNEISKWILVDTPKKNTWKDNPLNKKNHLHECLTALLSSWICKEGSKELNKSFDYLMLLHNIEKYNTYYYYANLKIPSVIQCITICRIETKGSLYSEILNLLLEASEKDNTLDNKNFTTIIVNNNNIQKIVVKYFEVELTNPYLESWDIIYGLMDDTNKKTYSARYTAKKFGL